MTIPGTTHRRTKAARHKRTKPRYGEPSDLKTPKQKRPKEREQIRHAHDERSYP